MPEPVSDWLVPGPLPLGPVDAPSGATVEVWLSRARYGEAVANGRRWSSVVRDGVWSHPPTVLVRDLPALADLMRARLFVCVAWAGREVGVWRVRVVR